MPAALAGHWLGAGWAISGHWLGIGWALAGHWLGIGWVLAGHWLGSKLQPWDDEASLSPLHPKLPSTSQKDFFVIFSNLLPVAAFET
jgi:hypothetical protein